MAMRWIVRKAKISDTLRTSLEQHGVQVVQQVVADSVGTAQANCPGTDWDMRHTLLWLTEQYQREDQKHTWSVTMEVAIILLIAAELTFSVINFMHKPSH
jgi:hypothetical protein